ncbi:hypothetical protein GCM10011401_04360 [Nesterenkonia cremea]|uniref:Uncharacterized protein n=1 Tax=Nesterenkonia cremea TaxID=1882340 RepID=A0A917AMW9_9MICC|nr:hypothetical protein GCM10011401_04360 [Nesterenkonia cremea]
MSASITACSRDWPTARSTQVRAAATASHLSQTQPAVEELATPHTRLGHEGWGVGVGRLWAEVLPPPHPSASGRLAGTKIKICG